MLWNTSQNLHDNTSIGDHVSIGLNKSCLNFEILFTEHLWATASTNSLFSMWFTQCMSKSNTLVKHKIFRNSALRTKEVSLLFVYWLIYKTLLYLRIHHFFQTSIQFFHGLTVLQKQPLEVFYKKKLFLKVLLNSQQTILFFNKVTCVKSKKETRDFDKVFSCEFLRRS